MYVRSELLIYAIAIENQVDDSKPGRKKNVSCENTVTTQTTAAIGNVIT